MLKNNYKKIIRITVFVILIIMISLFFCYPYLNKLPIFGHDISYHFNRINEITNGLRDGQFPVLIHSDLVSRIRIC